MNDRYARQRLIPELDQERLGRSEVLVLGVGALGNEVLSHLAAAGVGKLTIVDFDQVELTNLHRTLLFREGDIGNPKAASAARELRRLNPEVEVEAIEGDFRFVLGLGYFRRAQVVAGCLDSIEARTAAAQLCALAGVPYIDGGTAGLIGEVRHYLAGEGPCYACAIGRDARHRLLARWSCAGLALTAVPEPERPALGATSGVIGSHQAMAILLTLLGRQESWGFAHLYDGIRGRMENIRLPRDPECPNHDGPLEIAGTYPGSVENTSAADLDRAFGPLSGIRLRHTLVTHLSCECGSRWEKFRPLASLKPDELRCPECGRERTPETLVTLEPSRPEWHATFAKLAVAERDCVGQITQFGTTWLLFNSEEIP